MSKEQLEKEITPPQWDIALEALVKEECQKLGRPLVHDDFLRLAKAHAIRYDDIMDTVLRMTILGAWQYRDAGGKLRTITQETLDDMYQGGRLKDEDLEEYTGEWSPVKD